MDAVTCLLSFGLACSAPSKPKDPEPLPGVDDFSATEPAATKGEASKIVAKVQKFYDETTDFEASFEQTYVQAVYGAKTVSDGTLRVKRPGKMVWDYKAEDTPDFWMDGKNAWAVERDTKQVLKVDVASSDFAGAAKFLFGGHQLMDEFKVRMAGEKLVKRYASAGHSAVQMRPLVKNPHYQELLLVVDDATGRVDAFVVLNGDGSTNHFVLDGMKRNGGLADELFKFVKPKGFTEIEG